VKIRTSQIDALAPAPLLRPARTEHARSLGAGGARVSAGSGRDAPRAQEWIGQCETLISRRGHRIAFRRRGQGPTVLMLHGFPTGLSTTRRSPATLLATTT